MLATDFPPAGWFWYPPLGYAEDSYQTTAKQRAALHVLYLSRRCFVAGNTEQSNLIQFPQEGDGSTTGHQGAKVGHGNFLSSWEPVGVPHVKEMDSPARGHVLRWCSKELL